MKLSSEEYAAIVEQAPIMIWRSDTTMKCDYFNLKWLEFTGHALERELGDGWVEGVHPEDKERCLQIYVAAFERRETFEMRYRLRRSCGEFRWIFDRGVPYRTENGEFAGYIGSCIDVTDQVKAEASLARMAELEIRTLRGMLPICSGCKKIRDDKGYWQQVEVYIRKHSEAVFTHGLCPPCVERYSAEP